MKIPEVYWPLNFGPGQTGEALQSKREESSDSPAPDRHHPGSLLHGFLWRPRILCWEDRRDAASWRISGGWFSWTCHSWTDLSSGRHSGHLESPSLLAPGAAVAPFLLPCCPDPRPTTPDWESKQFLQQLRIEIQEINYVLASLRLIDLKQDRQTRSTRTYMSTYSVTERHILSEWQRYSSSKNLLFQ